MKYSKKKPIILNGACWLTINQVLQEYNSLKDTVAKLSRSFADG
jgi:hypothetical protein